MTSDQEASDDGSRCRTTGRPAVKFAHASVAPAEGSTTARVSGERREPGSVEVSANLDGGDLLLTFDVDEARAFAHGVLDAARYAEGQDLGDDDDLDEDRAPPEPVAALLAELEAAAAREDRTAVASTLRELADHYGLGCQGGSTVSGP